ncbi:MAG: tRNA 4-thiouridine(8) synthase ThiI [Clostridia bacterium]|nr:tRNA 4-thiouridine(8) synthase ThiI [Clostridia bacterium]
MKKVIILRYSEIYLKGTNRGYFEKMLINNIEKSLKGVRHEIHREMGRYLVDGFNDEACEDILERLRKVFGIHTLSVATKVDTDMDQIFEACREICRTTGTFKVFCHRADKTFALTSMEIAAEIGGRLCEAFPDISVDLRKPQFTINIDVRENKTSLIFGEYIKGQDGMPIGTAGKGLLLLSGGIDSPVAGHMIARRGMTIDCLHFHSYPYTNLQAREKVIELAHVLCGYTGKLNLYIVSVTAIQEAIHKNCNPDYMVTILRRFMMRIAERIAKREGINCLITGEALGQVASQTIEGMTSSQDALESSLPVLRPLCGFDKDEIIERSKAIGAYDISIQPYEDCCTVFLPRHPVIRPAIADVEAEEAKLPVDELIAGAMKTLETIKM